MTSHLKGPSDGEWSVFAEKVVEERDDARKERDEALSLLRKETARNAELQKQLEVVRADRDLLNKQWIEKTESIYKERDNLIAETHRWKEAERKTNEELEQSERQCAVIEAAEKRGREVMKKLIELRATSDAEYWWKEARSLAFYSPSSYGALREWTEVAVKAGDDNVEGENARKIRPLSEVVDDVMKRVVDKAVKR